MRRQWMWPYEHGSARDVLAYITAMEVAIATLELCGESGRSPMVLV